MLKWDIPQYWDNIILKSKGNAIFKDDSVTESTVFAYFKIANAYSNEIYIQWIRFPCIQAFIGYLKLKFLPQVIVSLFNPSNEIFQTESIHSKEALEIIQSSDRVEDKSKIGYFRIVVELINLIEQNGYDIKLISDMVDKYNDITKDNLDRLTSMYIFLSADELGDFIVTTYEESDLGIEGFYEDFQMTEEELLDICRQCYSNKFIGQKFLDIIDNKLSTIML